MEMETDARDAWFVDLFVRQSNVGAIAFYEKAGYSVFRVVKDYYLDHAMDPSQTAEDAFDMRKALRRYANREYVSPCHLPS